MRKRYIALGLLFVAGFLFFSFRTYNDEETKNELLMKLIVQSLNSNHYDPYEINDNFSERVFDLYLERLDYNKRYFTQSDVREMQAYRRSIDDQVLNSEYEFFDLSVEILDRRIDQVQSFYKEILIEPFDFTINEEVELDPDEMEWAKNDDELRERWRKVLKFQVLSRLSSKLDMKEGLDDEEEKEKVTEKSDDEEEEDLENMSFEEMEEKARKKVMENYNEWERRLEQLETSDRRATYFNAIVNTYDPHTSYYPPKDKENFDIQMSGRLEGIGASLQEENGYIKVVRIVPGSPSYLQGELQEDDVILKVGQGSEEPVDVVDMRLDDAVQLIRGKKGTEVRLTVKKVDGENKVIPIIRDVVVLEETYAKSAIMQTDDTKGKVGYIRLPKFYADFRDPNGRRCATDVAEEIEKLKAEGIEGIVLDLRNNGGGSLMDVVEMAGLFIEKGPIVQIKGRYGQPQILYDRNSNVQWDGPLVVMVNSSSASASEILAAAIQDYKRGIIAGTPTFGKGTVQRFYKLDNFVRGVDELKPFGDIKLTTQKFYRVNGGATQLKGVTPDVILPDAYTYIDRGERLQDFAMEWDEIDPANYKGWGLDMGVYSKIRKNSRSRVNDHKVYGLIRENAERLKRQRDLETRSLNLETYRANEKKYDEEAKKYKNIQQPIEGTEISNLPADLEKIGSDTVRQRLNDEWFERLEKDVYIDEAMAIIGDLK